MKKKAVKKALTDGSLSNYGRLLNKTHMLQAIKKSQWLIDYFLMRGSLNMIYASAGVGKSLLSLELAHFLAKQTDVSKIIYLDGDNSKAALSARGLDEILESNGTKLEYYLVNHNKQISMFNKLQTYNLNNVVIIIDSIRNFINFDIKDDIKTTRFLHKLQGFRKQGATIIFLHH